MRVKPATFNGRAPRAGAIQVLLWAFIIAWMALTLPAHVLSWAFTGRGFVRESPAPASMGFIRSHQASKTYAPPPWAAYGSILAAAGIILFCLR